MVFTGDALLVDGCGRTDLEGGDAAALYRSVHAKLFTLPDDTLVYPGHDDNQRRVSTIAQERARNQRLKAGTSFEEFTTIMGALELPRPKKSDFAVSRTVLATGCPTARYVTGTARTKTNDEASRRTERRGR